MSAAEWLDAWERALALTDLERPLNLIAAATDLSRDALAQMSIGSRNDHLLALRALVFGNELNAVAECPACGETLELPLRVSDLRSQAVSPSAPTGELAVNGYALTYRLPNTSDLIAARHAQDANAARETLLRRVLTKVATPDESNGHHLPDERVLEALNAQLEGADPLAALRVQLMCPNCGNEWESIFDIAAFFWVELDAWAKRVLREVHALASAYGWSEQAILALSPQRRQLYLEMTGQ
jgi:predicted RNA-binding Zn-ribbon protein involved in translation (DUF1610 family)